MKKSYILTVMSAALMLAGCGKEMPFEPGESGEGQILKSALAVDLKADETIRQSISTRAGELNINEFTVVFTRDGQSQPYASYKYADMPDIVVLPIGDYTCTAYYGENRIAEWENPYFMGQSEKFSIAQNEITSYIDPIECRLENIKVTIELDPLLKSSMSADSYVEVKVGANSGLNFTTSEIGEGKAGYFMHTAETTLVATFYGDIDGNRTVESKSYKNVEKGNHYKITFKLHNGGQGSATGDIDSDIRVDASVSVTDVERDIQVEDDVLDDSERPKEDPDDPTPPGPSDPKAPEIIGVAPINIDGVNVIKIGDSDASCILNVKSTAEGGFTTFYCDIESPDLTPEELAGVGLSSHIDIVSPGDLEGALQGLGLPVNVGGQKEVEFNLTAFLPLLGVFGEGQHSFVLTVGDANGTTVKTLILKFEN